MNRFVIIGNAGGGKSTLAGKLCKQLKIPLYDVDMAHVNPNGRRRTPDEIEAAYNTWMEQPHWIIDGWGTWPQLDRRFDLADKIVVVDLPLIRHYWWAIKRHVKIILGIIPNWPPPGYEFWAVTIVIFKNIYQIHTKMRPELLRRLEPYRASGKLIELKSPKAIRAFLRWVGQ